MTDNAEKAWVWQEAGDYDRWTAAEAGIYYERYNDLLDLVVVRCQVRQGDWVHRAGTALDIGTGTGELARRFAQNRGCRVVGLDPSAGMIREAERKAAAESWGDVSFQVTEAPFLEIPYPDGTFQAIGSTQAFHHLHERHKPAAVREMARVLKDGGRLAIGDPMFQNRADLEAALTCWPDELEDEYFAYLETLGPMFHDMGLNFHAERLSRINWVVWGEKSNGLVE
jgi:ubiquinone/menaquinone biosynthesis C-methylase UbiE